MDNPTRRRVLTAGVAGTALGLLGVRTAAASQATTTTSTTSTTTASSGAPTTEATTTTLPPRQPTAADIPLLNFAESIELAARDLYGVAIAAGVKDDAIAAMQSNHRGYADVIRGILGTNSNGRRNEELYSTYADRFNVADAASLAAAAYELESTLVATHIALLGELIGTDPARRIAAILIVEGRHAAVLADIGGQGSDFTALFEDSARALTPQAEG